jgi:hypothetical protein
MKLSFALFLFKFYDKYHNPALFSLDTHELFLCGGKHIETGWPGKIGGGGGKAFLQSKNLCISAFKQFT